MAMIAVLLSPQRPGYWWTEPACGTIQAGHSGLYPIIVNGKYGVLWIPLWENGHRRPQFDLTSGFF